LSPRSEFRNAKDVAFVTSPEIFVELSKSCYAGACGTLGVQPFTIGNSEVWLPGSACSPLVT
jgi:hypothetical protein